MKSIKKDWLPNLIRDWSPMSSQKPDVNGKRSPTGSPTRETGSIPTGYKVAG